MKVKILSQLSEVNFGKFSEKEIPGVVAALEAFGFTVVEKESSKGKGYAVLSPEEECLEFGFGIQYVWLEVKDIQELLDLADKVDVELIYSQGEWTIFNDPYAFC